jgi:predicted ribosome quality control (RQC) complex YloA/Tae2 family protein
MWIILKTELSSLDIAVITLELNHTIKESRINNIYQINHRTLLLKLGGAEGFRSSLIIEAAKRVHTSSYVFKTPLKPSNFCMALRKYIKNGKIKKIQQRLFERIIEIYIVRKGEKYCLIAELFGKGNIILVNPKNVILHSLSFRRMKDRNVLRGEIYIYPPHIGEDPRFLNRESYNKIKDFASINIVSAISRFLSIGGFYAEEILLRADISKKTKCPSLKEEDLDSIFNTVQIVLSRIESENTDAYVFLNKNKEWINVSPLKLKKYIDFEYSKFSTFNKALDEYYIRIFFEEKITEVQDYSTQEIDKLERILENQEKTLIESKRKAKIYHEIGDTIYMHLNELHFLINSIMMKKRSGKKWEKIIETWKKEKQISLNSSIVIKSLKSQTLLLQVSLEGYTFDLDLNLSAQKNGANYYLKAKKLKKKIIGVKKAIIETKKKLEKENKRLEYKIETKSFLKIKKREWYEKFRWFYSSDGFLIIAGRDASTNEILIKKHMDNNDIVFHADIHGAPFVLIKTRGKEIPQQTIKETAQFAASYSSGWKEGIGALDTYWILPNQVSKTPPSGEHLQKGSFMIYGKKNYLHNIQLEISIGVKIEDGQLNIIGGPTEAISSQTKIYIQITLGREKSGKLAKQIRNRLAQIAPTNISENILKIPLEDIQKFIPSGRGAIKK